MGLGDRLRRTGKAQGREAARKLGARVTPRRRSAEPTPEQLHVEAQRERHQALEDARRALADLAVHQRRAELSAQREAQAVQRYRDDARRAVAAGDDATAHDLLDRLEDHAATARTWRERADSLAAQVAESRRTVSRLERQAEAAASRQAALLADTQAAQARERLARAVPALEGGVGELDRRLARAEAVAAGRAEVAWHDSESDTVQRAFQELAHGEDPASRLARLEERSELSGPRGSQGLTGTDAGRRLGDGEARR